MSDQKLRHSLMGRLRRRAAACGAGEFCREIMFSIAAAILFTVILETGELWLPEIFDRLSVGEIANDIAVDWADIRHGRRPREIDSPSFVFVDFDRIPDEVETQGASVSRGDLAKLISKANDAGASVIVVDFALYGAGDEAADTELARVLATSQADIVIPAFTTNDGSVSCFRDESRSDEKPRQLLPQALETVGGESRVWIGIDDLAPEVDGRLRRSCLLTPAMRVQDGRRVAVPSIAALAAALWKRNLAPPEMRGEEKACSFWDNIIQAGDEARRVGPAPTACARVAHIGPKRIEFWPIREKPRPGDQYPVGVMQHLPVSPSLLRDGFPQFSNHPIVVIGSTGPLAFDTANTPFGRLHGAEVFIDEMNSIAKYKDDDAHPEIGFWTQLLLLDLPISVAGAALFAMLSSLPRALASYPCLERFVDTVDKRAWLRNSLKAAWILGCVLVTLLITAIGGLALTGSWLVAGRMVDLSGLFYGLLVDLGGRLEKMFPSEYNKEPEQGASK